MASSHCRYKALPSSQRDLKLIVVDIGYSSKKKSCGLVCSDRKDKGRPRHFGEAIEDTARLLIDLGIERTILVLEAPLSSLHDDKGNPQLRGDFEEGRGWYWGPGALTFIAARRFLEKLDEKLIEKLDDKLTPSQTVLLAEAFLSRKPEGIKHMDDARKIYEEFGTHDQIIQPRDGWERASALMDVAPPVHKFLWQKR